MVCLYHAYSKEQILFTFSKCLYKYDYYDHMFFFSRPDMDSQEEADYANSKWLNNVLNVIGVNDFRKVCQRLYMFVEILNVFKDDEVIEYIMGSTSEGTSTPGNLCMLR